MLFTANDIYISGQAIDSPRNIIFAIIYYGVDYSDYPELCTDIDEDPLGRWSDMWIQKYNGDITNQILTDVFNCSEENINQLQIRFVLSIIFAVIFFTTFLTLLITAILCLRKKQKQTEK